MLLCCAHTLQLKVVGDITHMSLGSVLSHAIRVKAVPNGAPSQYSWPCLSGRAALRTGSSAMEGACLAAALTRLKTHFGFCRFECPDCSVPPRLDCCADSRPDALQSGLAARLEPPREQLQVALLSCSRRRYAGLRHGTDCD